MNRQQTEYPLKARMKILPTLRLIKEFRREPNNPKNPRNQIVWRVCQWSSSPVPWFEKRKVYVKKDGTEQNYKMMGLGLDDLAFVSAHWGEILEALQA